VHAVLVCGRLGARGILCSGPASPGTCGAGRPGDSVLGRGLIPHRGAGCLASFRIAGVAKGCCPGSARNGLPMRRRNRIALLGGRDAWLRRGFVRRFQAGQRLQRGTAFAIGSGRFAAAFQPEQAGLYRVHATARRGTTPLGTADRWVYVGGGDREFADPRLNEGFLRRVARASGGRYVRAADASRIVAALQSSVPKDAAPERRDLWHRPWAFMLVVSLLAGEWILRRRWGLR